MKNILEMAAESIQYFSLEHDSARLHALTKIKLLTIMW